MTIDPNTRIDSTHDNQLSDVAPSTAGRRHAQTTQGTVEHSRAAAVWVGVVVAAVLAIALIVFLAQNQRHVTTRFLGYDGSQSLALTVLISAVVGALIVAIPATVRILQLRHAVKRNN